MKLRLLTLCTILPLLLHAQTPEWAKFYWGSSVSTGKAITNTNGSSFMGATSGSLLGCSEPPADSCILGTWDSTTTAYVLKLGADGEILNWKAFEPEVGYQTQLLSIQKAPDDGLYVLYRSALQNNNDRSFVLVRLNHNLETVWEKVLTDNQHYRVHNMASDTAGNVYTVTTNTFSPSFYDTLFFHKILPVGTTSWSQAAMVRAVVDGIVCKPDGSLALILNCSSVFDFQNIQYSGLEYRLMLVLDTSNGQCLHHAKLFSVPDFSWAQYGISFIADNSGNYLLAITAQNSVVYLLGQTLISPDPNASFTMTCFAVLDSNLELLEHQMMYSYSNNTFFDVRTMSYDATGALYVGGRVRGNGAANAALYFGQDTIPLNNGSSGAAVMKFNADLGFVWSNQWKSFGEVFSSNYADAVTNLAITGDNRIMAHGLMASNQVVMQDDTVYTSKCSAFLVKFGNNDQMSGETWVDLNTNGLRDIEDIGMPYVSINDADGELLGFTNASGVFSLNATGADLQTLRVDQAPFDFIPSPLQHNVLFETPEGEIFDSLDFRLTPTVFSTDLSIAATSLAPLRAGLDAQWHIVCSNLGVTTEDMVVSIPIPGLIQFEQADPPPAISGDTLIWLFPATTGFQKRKIKLHGFVNAGTPQDTVIVFYGNVSPLANDINPNNNAFTLRQTVTGSYDPNDKQSIPSGQIAADLTPELLNIPIDYLIRFQNTGTDTAFRVVVLDTLPALVDPATLRVIDRSHPMHIDLRGPNIVAFEFDNILLPDSATNEAASHGFVRFEIEPKQPLEPGDVVRNRAGIYFDFNVPIITNRAIIEVVLSVGTYTPKEGLNFSIYPNPVTDKLRLETPKELPVGGRVVLYDIQQRQLLSKTITGGQTMEMDLSGIPTGVCVLVLYDAQGKVLGAKKVSKL